MFKLRGTDQIPVELIKAEGEILCSKVQKLIRSIWNKEKFSQQRKRFIVVPIHEKGDITDCNNYRLTPYVNEIIGDHLCGFRRNRANID
jgi:hypothetical protein